MYFKGFQKKNLLFNLFKTWLSLKNFLSFIFSKWHSVSDMSSLSNEQVNPLIKSGYVFRVENDRKKLKFPNTLFYHLANVFICYLDFLNFFLLLLSHFYIITYLPCIKWDPLFSIALFILLLFFKHWSLKTADDLKWDGRSVSGYT